MPADFANLLASNVRDLGRILPELFVAVAFLWGLVVDLAVPPEHRRRTAYVCVLFLVLALWTTVLELRVAVEAPRQPYKVLRAPGGPGQAGAVVTFTRVAQSRPLFSRMMARDTYGLFFNAVLLVGTIVALLVALNARQLEGRHRGEFLLLLVAVCLGGMFLAAATNLLMIYLSLEALSVVSYALAGFLPQDRKSAEAGIKYAIYGAVASGLMIFGMSYLYGLTGTLDLRDAGQRFQGLLSGEGGGVASRGALLVVLGLIFSGFLYKIAAVPFHFWSPDVYEGAPTTATAFFSVVPKAAGFAVLVRVVATLFPLDLSWLAVPGPAAVHAYARMQAVRGLMEWAALILAFLTMTLGNLAALGQSNAKRMLAYSSIAHAGYMLSALATLQGTGGAAALLYYVPAYLFMNLGAFLVLVGLENQTGSCDLERLRGSVRRAPLLSVALVVFLFSLVGLPPLAGFTAKYLVMLALADVQNWFLVLAIGINSVISLFYYMRLAKAVVMDPPAEEAAPPPQPPEAKGASAIYQVLAIGHVAGLAVLFVWFEPVHRLCRQVVEALR